MKLTAASPRTQSALLQAMQEKSVTVAGRDRPLGVPFHVLATQNPIEQEGTYPLPEAQLDRFLLEIQVPYPDRATERDILLATTGAQEAEVSAVFDPEQLLAAQALIRPHASGRGDCGADLGSGARGIAPKIQQRRSGFGRTCAGVRGRVRRRP